MMRIGIVGDFSAEYPSQTATNQALQHSADKLGLDIEYEWLPTARIVKEMDFIRQTYQGFWIGPGFPDSMDGVLEIIRFARENDAPLLGTCGGFQYMILEYARNKMGLRQAGHEEREPDADQIVIGKLACSLVGEISQVTIDRYSRAYAIYQAERIAEPFRCNYGLRSDYQRRLHEAGLEVVGTDSVGNARIVELPGHLFYMGTLFVPQLVSSSEASHCVVDAFLSATCRRITH